MFGTAFPAWFGVPAPVVLAALAAALFVVGYAWLRRITSVPDEPRSFLATVGERPNAALRVGLVLAALAIAALVVTR